MTKEEIKNPEIIEKQTTRLGRIAKGSGTTTSDIRQLIKQYKYLLVLIIIIHYIYFYNIYYH